MKKKQGPAIIEMTEEELNALRERIKAKQLIEDDYPIVEQTIQFVLWVQVKLEHAKITMSKFKKLLFGSKTEKKKRSKNDADNTSKNKNATEQLTNETFDQSKDEAQAQAINIVSNQDMNIILPSSNVPEAPKLKNKGHGRIAASEYTPDEVIVVMHETLKVGDDCPNDCGGRLYALTVTPGGIIRVQGAPCSHVFSY